MNIVVSSHCDTVFTFPFGEIRDGYYVGACDNFVSMLSIGRVMENLQHVHFTEDEEMYFEGARAVAKKCSPEDTLIIVCDVTKRSPSWKKIHFTIENYHGVDEKHIKKALKDFNGRYRMNPNGEESEAWLYRNMGFPVIEIDIPVSGGLHNLDAKCRIEDITETSKGLLALHEYFKDKDRAQISDTYRVDA